MSIIVMMEAPNDNAVTKIETKVKVFYLGFHRTGTTTMKVLLESLGYRVRGLLASGEAVQEAVLSESIIPLREIVRQFDAFQDNPWPLLFKSADEEFPGAKFIFHHRDPDDWYDSASRYFGNRSTSMRKWIYGEGCGSPIGNKAVYLARYLRHREQVLKHFTGSANFLSVDLFKDPQAGPKISKFLGTGALGRIPHAHKF